MRLIPFAVLSCALLIAASGHAAVDDQLRKQALEHYRAGEAAMFAERWAEAEPEFKAVIKLDRLMFMAHHRLGECYMAMHEYEDALRAFLQARDVFKEIAASNQSGDTELDRQRDEQIREMRDSISLLQTGRIKASDIPQQILRLDARIHDMERMKQRRGRAAEEPPELTFAVGSAFLHLNRMADAEREYLEAIKARPNFGEAHNNLSVVYMNLGRLDDARKSVAMAEKCGFPVNPGLKKEIARRIGPKE